MDLGIGLPNTVPGTTGRQLTDFARAAEDAGFSTLGTVDRIVYANYEPVVALSAAAAVTERIGLATSVLLGPLRRNAAVIAKQFLSLDALAGGGRAILGIGIGGRDDDYAISEVDMSTRGEWQDAALARIREIWDGKGEVERKVGPRTNGDGPSLIVGGQVEAAFERAAKFGDGWMQGGSGPDQLGQDVEALDAAWKAAGRDGEPRTMALGYYSLGPDAESKADAYLTDYYAWMGDEVAGMIAASALKDADSVKGALQLYEEKGCDELILFPSSPEPEQVALLAEAAGL